MNLLEGGTESFQVKLIIPYIDVVHPADGRLLRLAEFLGVGYELLRLEGDVRNYAQYLAKALPGRDRCILLNAGVIQKWTRGSVPAELAPYLKAHYDHLLVCGVAEDQFCHAFIRALTDGAVQSVKRVTNPSEVYNIAPDSTDICGPFAGMSFGPVNVANDHILNIGHRKSFLRGTIAVGRASFMSVGRQDQATLIIIGSSDTTDIDTECSGGHVGEYFSRFLPCAMALRHIFGDQCWKPCGYRAAITIDDPLLQPQYGFLNYEKLLRLLNDFDLSATIGFIPNNYRRSAPEVARLFCENSHRLSICFHGNDHTAQELASSDRDRLNAIISMAEKRMQIHEKTTGLRCGRIMVCPQEYFSSEALEVLKAHGFAAATSSMSHPAHQAERLRLRDLAQPAVLKYGGFPLFLRRYIRELTDMDIGVSLFFGRPLLIVEHHDIFKKPQTLIDAALAVNAFAPGIKWADLESTVRQSSLVRIGDDGCEHIRAYSTTVQVANRHDAARLYEVEWCDIGQRSATEGIVHNGTLCEEGSVSGESRVRRELPAHSSAMFSLIYQEPHSTRRDLGVGWKAKVYLRRRLSEMRDNYLSKSEVAMTLAQAFQRRVLSRVF